MQNPNLTAFTFKIQVFCRPKWIKGEVLWKWILAFFKHKNEFPKQLGLLNSGTSIMISAKAPEKEAPQGKVLEFFLLDTLKVHFEWKI